MKSIFSLSAEETFELGKDFALGLNGGEIIAFVGELGAGKTVFIQGLCEGLGVDDYVNSPSFTLVNEYSGRFEVLHFDCYRLESEEEFEMLGYQEFLGNPEYICLIEWANKITDLLPDDTIWIDFNKITFEKRKITVYRGKK